MTRRDDVMPGVRLKFRTSSDGLWFTATIWMDGEPLQVIATLHQTLAPTPGCDAYQGWIKVVSDAFAAMLHEATGYETKMLRRKPAEGTP